MLISTRGWSKNGTPGWLLRCACRMENVQNAADDPVGEDNPKNERGTGDENHQKEQQEGGCHGSFAG